MNVRIHAPCDHMATRDRKSEIKQYESPYGESTPFQNPSNQDHDQEVDEGPGVYVTPVQISNDSSRSLASVTNAESTHFTVELINMKTTTLLVEDSGQGIANNLARYMHDVYNHNYNNQSCEIKLTRTASIKVNSQSQL